MKLETAKMVLSAPPRNASAVFLPIGTAAVAVGTFVADTVDPNDLSFPLLYIVVVLMAARLCRGRDLVLVAVGCLALLALSYLISPPIGSPSEALLRLSIRSTVIGLTAYLVLQNQSAEASLREKVALLDLAQDTVSSAIWTTSLLIGTAARRNCTAVRWKKPSAGMRTSF